MAKSLSAYMPESLIVSMPESPSDSIPSASLSSNDNRHQSAHDKPVLENAYDFNNIYFSVKTTESNYKERLELQMMTWFQVVKNKVSSCVWCTYVPILHIQAMDVV